jgi:predicted GNAT family acetyltransferase
MIHSPLASVLMGRSVATVAGIPQPGAGEFLSRPASRWTVQALSFRRLGARGLFSRHSCRRSHKDGMGDLITHVEQDGRGGFYIERSGTRVGELTYRRTAAARVIIDHTEVDPGLRGQGIARRLLDAAVAWARQTGTKITPRCSYAVVQFNRDKSIGDVLARDGRAT